MKKMTQIQEDLDRAISFIRSSRSLDSNRDRLIEQLTKDLLHLDGTESSPERREMIYAIQNVISQLEHLYDQTKPPILLKSPNISREAYLPAGRHSHYALADTFDEN